MGNRATIVVENDFYEDKEPSRVYLYAHWGGQKIFQHFMEGLDKQAGTPEYAARAVFSRMVADDLEGAMNYGLAAIPMESEHPVPVICFRLRETVLYFEDREAEKKVSAPLNRRHFEEVFSYFPNWRELAEKDQLYNQLIEAINYFDEHGDLSDWNPSYVAVKEWKKDPSKVGVSDGHDLKEDDEEKTYQVGMKEAGLGFRRVARLQLWECTACHTLTRRWEEHLEWHEAVGNF